MLTGFVGQARPQLTELSEKVNDYLARFPSVFSGTYLSPDSRLLNIGVTDQGQGFVATLKAPLAILDPGATLTRLVPAGYSFTKLEEIKSSIVKNYLLQHADEVNSVSIDPSQDAVVVGVGLGSEQSGSGNAASVAKIALSYGDRWSSERTSGKLGRLPATMMWLRIVAVRVQLVRRLWGEQVRPQECALLRFLCG